MITKNIYKLKELHKFEWEFQGKKLTIRNNAREDRYDLYFSRFLDWGGNIISELQLFRITARNLSELELFGLKVILNEKPKISRGERDFLERINENDIWITRDEEGEVNLWDVKPYKVDKFWACTAEEDQIAIQLHYDDFVFITWESGKAWSKSELMELEVMD